MSLIQECQNKLVMISDSQGFLTFEDIMNVANSYNLSIVDVDKLSEAIQLLGILIYEDSPLNETIEEAEDYSRVDYDSIFDEVKTLAPGLAPFIDEIQMIVPPQYGEVTSLTVQAAAGNTYARERLILSHLRIAVKTALAMTKHRHLCIEDAIGAACTGLITGTDRYDPNGFSTFQGYISMWIQQAIQRDCKPTWMEYYYPVHARERIIPVYEEYLSLDCGDYSYDRTISGIAQKHNMDISEIDTLIESAIAQEQSKANMVCDETTFEIVDDNAVDPCEHTATLSFANDVRQALMTLKEREAQVIMMRFGINQQSPMTLEEVGTAFGLTRERIRQIESKTLKKLKRNKSLRLYV